MKQFFIFFLIFSFIATPALSLAQSSTWKGLVPCGTESTPIVTDKAGKQTGGEVINPCNFDFFLGLINKLIEFILFFLAIPIAAIMFAYAGFELVTSGGEAAKRTKAKDVFFNAVIGLVIAAAGYLIIKTVLLILGYDGAWIGF